MLESRVATTLATYLYVSDATTETLAALTAADRDQALALIHQTDDRHGPEAAPIALAETAYALGDHPETAAPRWCAALDAAHVAAHVLVDVVPGQRQEVVL